VSKNRPQCGILIENGQAKVLLQLRDDRQDIPYPNCWGTFGGQIEQNETSEQAVAREIMEELQYELHDPEFFGIFPFDGYDIYMFKKVVPEITMDDVVVKEGQEGAFMSLDEVLSADCAFNCKEIVAAYYARFHENEK
jgi:8-oxo-dGTP diphosphatase